MTHQIERRRSLRVPLILRVVLLTPKGTIKGKTGNISVDGALLLFLEKPEVDNLFQITIESPENKEMPVTCVKAWSGRIVVDESVYTGIGARFLEISPKDRNILASLVKGFDLV